MSKVARLPVAAHAHSPTEALARIRDKPIDLILPDHNLPDRNSPAVMRELHARGHRTDVIMVTAARDAATAKAALRLTVEGGGEAEHTEVDRPFGTLWAVGKRSLPE